MKQGNIIFYLSCFILLSCKAKTIIPNAESTIPIIENVRDLTNVPDQVNMVILKGYHFDGDGGGGMVIKNTKAKDVDGGMVLSGNDCTWSRVNSTINDGAIFGIVENKNSKINIDGNIVNFLNSNFKHKSNIVYFPKGVFHIKKSILIPEGMLINGNGMGSTIVVADGNFSAFILNYNTTLIYSGVKDLEIQTSAKPNTNAAITFENSDKNDIRAAHYYEVDKVRIMSYYADSECRFDVGILSRYWLGRITNCFISRVNKIGIHLYGDEKNPTKYSIQTVIVDNNIIGTITDAKDGIGIAVNKADGAVIIQNNNIEGQQKTGIKISFSKNLTLLNNYFESSIKGIPVTNLYLYESAYINIMGGFFTSGDKDHPSLNYSIVNCRDINMFGINTNNSNIEIQNGNVNYYGGMHDTDHIKSKAKGHIRFSNVYDFKTSKIISQE